MEITYLGHSSFRIKTKTATIVTDPFDPKMVGLKFPKVEADIVTLSHDHADHNQAGLVMGYKKSVTGPGEYEIQGVSLIGFASYHDDQKGALRGPNTIYLLEAEGLRLVHLGDLGHALSEEVVGAIGDVDVLMVPVGGVYTLDPTLAVEVVKAIGAKLVIPMHYADPGLNQEAFKGLAPVEEFLSRVGIKVEKTDKLKIDAPLADQESIILLSRKNG